MFLVLVAVFVLEMHAPLCGGPLHLFWLMLLSKKGPWVTGWRRRFEPSQSPNSETDSIRTRAGPTLQQAAALHLTPAYLTVLTMQCFSSGDGIPCFCFTFVYVSWILQLFM
jgi:hypothetical protein